MTHYMFLETEIMIVDITFAINYIVMLVHASCSPYLNYDYMNNWCRCTWNKPSRWQCSANQLLVYHFEF